MLWEGRGEEVEREPVSPDVGSSEWLVRDNAGEGEVWHAGQALLRSLS